MVDARPVHFDLCGVGRREDFDDERAALDTLVAIFHVERILARLFRLKRSRIDS